MILKPGLVGVVLPGVSPCVHCCLASLPQVSAACLSQYLDGLLEGEREQGREAGIIIQLSSLEFGRLNLMRQACDYLNLVLWKPDTK